MAKGRQGGRQPFDPKKVKAPLNTPSLFAQQGPAQPSMLTVTALNRLVRAAITKEMSGALHVVGELSNLSRPSGGHVYFTLKDDESEVRCVMWQSAASTLKFEPLDGMAVIATGTIDVYEPRGQVQFYVRKLEPRGVGSLELAFRQLRDRLQNEGLFDAARKRKLPRFPARIAIVTSPTGAALHDVLQTLQRRFPCIDVLVFAVRVQGEGAAREIADAIRRINLNREKLGGVDAMIVGRGGGSLEDLWAFNEEAVARAIFASEIPIITAVGHETDFTIADFVADLRAATPTAAAELVAPHCTDLIAAIDAHAHRMTRSVLRLIEQSRSRLALAERSEGFRNPMVRIAQRQQQVDDAAGRLSRAAEKLRESLRRAVQDLEVRLERVRPQTQLAIRRESLIRMEHRLHWVQLEQLSARTRQLEHSSYRLRTAGGLRRVDRGGVQLTSLADRLGQAIMHELARHGRNIEHLLVRLQAGSHEQILKRGFTITRRTHDGSVVRSARDAQKNDVLTTQTSDGDLRSRVE